PLRLARPGVGALPACADAGRRLYVVWASEEVAPGAPIDDGSAVEDAFVPLHAGSALLGLDAGRFAFGRAFAWGRLVAPFARPDTPPAPPVSETARVRVEAAGEARAYDVTLGSGRFERAASESAP